MQGSPLRARSPAPKVAQGYGHGVREVLTPPKDAPERLRIVDAFAHLDDDGRQTLVREVEWLRLDAGDVLFEQGDVADAAYFVIRGRVRAFVRDRDGERAVGDRGPGGPVGEVGVLADVPRTATVRAVRDTELVRVDPMAFDRIMARDLRITVPIVRVIAQRLADALVGGPSDVNRASVVGLVVAPDQTARDAADSIADELGRRTGVARVRHGDEPITSLIARLDENERHGIMTVLEVAAGEDAASTLRQADRVVVVQPEGSAVDARADDLLEGYRRTGVGTHTELVLVHTSRHAPAGTAARAEQYDEVHHVRAGARADFARIARHLTGTAIGLVLGGGGARAMAHIGAYRALLEAGIPIDRVGGSSIGGVIAAEIAGGMPADDMQEVNRREFGSARLDRRFTFPLVSLLSPVAQRQILEHIFCAADYEDLWLPSFVTVVDLTNCRLALMKRGRVARWMLAAVTPPGIWPPIVGDDGALYVDGAILDNLPVVPMRALGPSRVISISVSRQPAFVAGQGVEEAPTPLAYARHLAGRRGASVFPNLVQTLNRTALVTGLERHGDARDASDCYIAPPLDRFGLADYARLDEIVTVGYDAMCRALDDAGDLASTWA